ncbi:MAG: hypothetical protein Q9M91_01445 [Candidatus Dojkabacteria bacterium]|nr:hypothetical protein [Candidatus Dojkabacteria bacterium]MDQ7020489.1 hypothetical protein [Candidatus Dojkabacteria bacterium]
MNKEKREDNKRDESKGREDQEEDDEKVLGIRDSVSIDYIWKVLSAY